MSFIEFGQEFVGVGSCDGIEVVDQIVVSYIDFSVCDMQDMVVFVSLKWKEQLDVIVGIKLNLMFLFQVDKDNYVLYVIDIGIGMIYNDLINNFGIIVRFGISEFLIKFGEVYFQIEMFDFIGQFGVGFYLFFLGKAFKKLNVFYLL